VKKVLLKILYVVLSLAVLSGCSSSSANSNNLRENETANTDTNSDDGEKKAILVVSFGTSYNETRKATIEAIENAITNNFSDFEVRRAFTSQTIIDKLAQRDGIEIDNVQQAMEKIVNDGIKTLIVQPTHIMNGIEYDEMVSAVDQFKENFTSLAYGNPLLSDDNDYKKLTEILIDSTSEYNTDKTSIVFMGHGTEHNANSTYLKLDKSFKDLGYSDYFIGTVEATPSFDDVLDSIKNTDSQKVVLLPLMIVAGDHTTNDMAGDEEDSWKTMLKKEGYEVECILKGLGEYDKVQQMFVEHTQNAINSIGK